MVEDRVTSSDTERQKDHEIDQNNNLIRTSTVEENKYSMTLEHRLGFAVFVPVPPERDQTQGAKAGEGHGYSESGQVTRHRDRYVPAYRKRA
jgi:hypothetical protein